MSMHSSLLFFIGSELVIVRLVWLNIMGKSREDEREVMARRTGSSFPSSSSDFEFTVSLSPSSKRSSSRQCPADELFYKGQILPLHLSPRISMVRTLLLSSSSSSSADTTTTVSRDSNGSASSSSSTADVLLLLPECDFSRPSSVTEEEEEEDCRRVISSSSSSSAAKRGKYFSSLANRFSSVFLNRSGGGGSKKDASSAAADAAMDADPPPTGKRANTTAKQVIKKYVSKVKPLYEKLKNQNQSQSQSQSQSQKKKKFFSIRRERDITLISSCSLMEDSMKKMDEEEEDHRGLGGGSVTGIFNQSHSFSGNLRYPRRKSCLSSMRSSPAHSGPLHMNGVAGGFPADDPPALVPSSSSSSMEELQNAIQGAIAHCKSTMAQPDPKKNISGEPQYLNCGLDVTSVH